jgi:hypothetical protein
MTGGSGGAALKKEGKKTVEAARRLAGLSQTAVDLVQQGKGTPQDTVALANALLRVRGEESSPADVRSRVLFDHNIGLDCSGRTSQSYLDALERTAREAHFQRTADEGLYNLSGRGYTSIPLGEARAGDIVVLGPPPNDPMWGHRAIVYDQREPTKKDMLMLESQTAKDFAADGHILVFELDSSWSAGPQPEDAYKGGEKRKTFLYNESTKKWAQAYSFQTTDSTTHQTKTHWYVDVEAVQEKIYGGHPIEGIYRLKGD